MPRKLIIDSKISLLLIDDVQEEILEGLPIVPPPQFRELSEIEEKKLRRKEEARLRELRIFLRYKGF